MSYYNLKVNKVRKGDNMKAALAVKRFFKNEAVLIIAFILAVVSCFFCPVSEKYLGYIDFRVLSILLGLMLVISGYKRIGIFDRICTFLLSKTHTIRQLTFVMVMICFFSSMLITNDVALVAFVPFALYALKQAGYENKSIFVVVLQTIAANCGSMLLPSGTPQNLYLYQLSGMSFGDFVLLMLPYTLATFAILTFIILVFCRSDPITPVVQKKTVQFRTKDKISLIFYTMLFVLGILTVCRIVPYYVFLGAAVILVAVLDYRAFAGADYSLLLTFVCFFIFIGNIGSIEAVRSWMQSLVNGREVLAGVVSSQFISNVPAALMLSGFTNRYSLLIIGTDLGGLGTLIASMASLISYKYYAREYHEKTAKNSRAKYLLTFTYYNIIFLAILLALYFILVSFGLVPGT